jgi:hypothetical protein
MNRIKYTIFLAVASAKEISQIFDLPGVVYINLIYLIFFFFLIIKVITNTLEPWVWRGAFSAVGFSALIFVILIFLGLPERPLEIVDCSICLWAWVKSIIYLNKYDENIRKI